MTIADLTDVARANDKFRASLRSTWIASPADTSLLVDAVPDNVPTYVVVGWETDLETVFLATGKSGTSASNYALTGVTRIKGANVNLPENTPVNCLNNEEFFNQYETKINAIIAEVNDALAVIAGSVLVGFTISESRIKSRVTTEASSATPTINTDNTDMHTITALATAITSMTTNLTGTPEDGDVLKIRIKDNGTARAITWGASFASRGGTLPTTTVLGKYQYNGFLWNEITSTWDCVVSMDEA